MAHNVVSICLVYSIRSKNFQSFVLGRMHCIVKDASNSGKFLCLRCFFCFFRVSWFVMERWNALWPLFFQSFLFNFCSTNYLSIIQLSSTPCCWWHLWRHFLDSRLEGEGYIRLTVFIKVMCLFQHVHLWLEVLSHSNSRLVISHELNLGYLDE